VSDAPRPPKPLADLLDEFRLLDRDERVEYLIEYAHEFESVPERIATRPYSEDHHVKRCQSDVFVWAETSGEDAQKYHFAVENPQGISAQAFCAILDKTASGARLADVAGIPGDIVFDIFGRDISMGKGEGLVGIVTAVTEFAKGALAERATA